MKVPKVIFIKHCPNLSPERKIFLDAHLTNRLNGKLKIIWVEDYNYDHQFIEFIQYKLKPPYGNKLVSNLVKTLFMLETMVKEDIESAFIIDDDIVFHKDWKEILESINLPDNILFLNLGTSTFFKDLKPIKGKAYQIQNNGGCEGIYVKKQFAEHFLKNINFGNASDIVFHGFLNSINHPIVCVPIINQTSIIERETTLDHDTRKEQNWIQYVQTYSSLKKESFYQLQYDFQKFLEIKELKEKKFFELYGKKINIKNCGYVLSDTQDFCNDILFF